MPLRPELEDLFRIRFREMSLELRTNTVGRVVSYDPATQTVNVTTEILQVRKDLETKPTQANPSPERVADPILLEGLPVAWPRSGSSYLTFPILPGTTGEIRVHDRSLQRWLELGQATDPISAWVHNLEAGVFSPTLSPSTDPITPETDQTATVLHGELIKLHREATDFVPLVQKLLTELEAFRTWANTHTHTGVTTGIGSTGTGTPKGPIGDISSEKVMAK